MEKIPNRALSGFAGAAVRTLALIGIVAVLLVGLWGAVIAARAVPGLFSAVPNTFSALASAVVSVTSTFIPAAKEKTLTIVPPPAPVQSGESFVLSWKYDRKGVKGEYTLSFACADGVSLSSPTKSGAMGTVPCDTQFEFLNVNDAVVLTARTAQKESTEISVAITFTPSGQGEPAVSGAALLTVENGSPEDKTPEGADEKPRTGGGITAGPETTTVEITSGTAPARIESDPKGLADLAIHMIETGVVDEASGEFTANKAPSRSATGKRIAVRFYIENSGTKMSDEWFFVAHLPTTPPHAYTSPIEQTLGPGERIEFTLGFDSFEKDNRGELLIIIDPESAIDDSNRDNNRLEETITIAD